MNRTKAYVIVAGTGDHSDRRTWPAAVLTDKESAQNLMLQLETIYETYQSRIRDLKFTKGWLEIDRFNPLAQAEYAALGFQSDVYAYDAWTDWELEESWLLS